MMKKKNKAVRTILDVWIQNRVRKNQGYFSRQLEYEMSSLNPGIDAKKLVYEHYVVKISLCLLILSAGVGILVLYVCSSYMNRNLKEERFLERAPVGGMEKTIQLDAQIEDVYIKGMSISVLERSLTSVEAEELLSKAAEQLSEVILGENESLTYVNKPMNLINTWDSVPITIFWDSSDFNLLQSDGSLRNGEIPKTGAEVVLTATLTYEEFSKTKKFNVKVYPPDMSEKEKMQKDLSVLVEQEQEKSKSKAYLELPETLQNAEIIWKEPIGELLPVLSLLILICIAAVFIGKDRDIHKQYEERDKQLLLEYPEFVSKLQLLFCSGMSLRSAMVRMGNDYQKSLKKGGRKKYVNEELLLAVRKMENGMNEAEVLEYFGKRCHLFCYKKLVSLIQQNLKRGSEGLREALLNETKNAFEERKQAARRLGEEAGTRLLLPMILMLGVVLIIIVVPAYFSFGGI